VSQRAGKAKKKIATDESLMIDIKEAKKQVWYKQPIPK